MVLGAPGARNPEDPAGASGQHQQGRRQGARPRDDPGALTSGDVVLLKPPAAVQMPGERASGETVYSKPSEFARYATAEHLALEGHLTDDAARPVAPVLDPEAAARAVGSDLAKIRAEQERQASDDGAGREAAQLSGTGLRNDQALATFGLLTSERGINVLVGAAGTGKSHVVARLAEIVRETSGGRVIGVASSTNAARVLKDEGLHDVFSIADFLGYVEGSDVRRGHLPVGPGDWLIIDEAGVTETTAIAELNEVVKARGAYLMLTGDPYGQQASVARGRHHAADRRRHGFSSCTRLKDSAKRGKARRLCACGPGRDGDTRIHRPRQGAGRQRG